MRLYKRGQSLVEFALILPVLLGVILGLIDGAFIMQGYLSANHAAREATRFAITYQPVQGECYDYDEDGVTGNDPYPWCPSSSAEGDDEYFSRRVQMIKLIANDAALGLRRQVFCDTSSCIQSNYAVPGMFGVSVWGFPSFEESEREDHPGIPGLPVRVQVVYNVPLVVFAPLLPNPYIRVSGATEMLNEGVVVGYGNLAPPTFRPLPTSIPPTSNPLTPGYTPGTTPTTGPTPTPTPYPDYNVLLQFLPSHTDEVTNLLPDDRSHAVGAFVTSPGGQPVAGAQVTFRTDVGSFEYSGTGDKLVTVSTSGDGWARTTIYANEPGLEATIRSWVDFNLNLNPDDTEPADTIVKTWALETPNSPYLIVSDHNPEPQAWIAVDVMNHDPAGNSHSLWWCPNAVTSTQVIQQLAFPVDVDTNGDMPDIALQVPMAVSGDYRIESHAGTGGSDGCADDASLIAYSSNIHIKEVPPDLIITALQVVTPLEERLTGKELTLTVEIQNVGPVEAAGGPFDIDLYLNLEDPPTQMQMGLEKQWLATLAPFETTVVTFVILPEAFGENTAWAQVDTTNYIMEGEEGEEDNNTFGPVEFLVECGVFDEARSDDFDGGLGGIWTQQEVGSGVNSEILTSGGQVTLRSEGTSLFSGNNNFFFVYQEYNGDFDARLQVIDEPDTNEYAKVGLMIRESVNTNAPYIMNVLSHYRSPAAEQMVYRDSPGATAYRISGSNNYQRNLPSWVRLVRKDNTYDYYYAYGDDPEIDDWVLVNSHTASRELGMIGIANASYNSSSQGDGVVDNFRICTAESNDLGAGDVNPPGLVECTELVSVPGFEGNPATVFQFWKAGEEAAAFSRTSEQFYQGSFSMRLSPSLYAYPCDEAQSNLHPYLYQEVEIPTEIYEHTYLLVDGHYFAAGSKMACSYGEQDADDELTLELQGLDGSSMMTPQLLANGALPTGIWHTLPVTLSDTIDLEAYAGQQVRLYWNATHDGDYYGTYFYMDNISAQVCTIWPVPDPEPGTASLGGQVTVIGEFNIPISMPGASVLAYAQGGDIYQTRAIQDGTYHFYNIPPGNYTVYAEAWVDTELRTARTTISVAADERNYNVNLLLQ
ncbi:MAG: pilus assembly protein [Anaerolineae bacterium]|nr:pilus assembly protein [Anaerolineae bacterium]